ncbi:hypothetical protein LINGRAHAP2_LOCUS4845 [Linum grandiflorum]
METLSQSTKASSSCGLVTTSLQPNTTGYISWYYSADHPRIPRLMSRWKIRWTGYTGSPKIGLGLMFWCSTQDTSGRSTKLSTLGNQVGFWRVHGTKEGITILDFRPVTNPKFLEPEARTNRPISEVTTEMRQRGRNKESRILEHYTSDSTDSTVTRHATVNQQFRRMLHKTAVTGAFQESPL